MGIVHLFPTRVRTAGKATHLREQAASCRRLASVARTRSGALALTVVAERFDEDARRADLAETTLAIMEIAR